MMLTQAQTSLYWRTFSRACAVLDITDSHEKEAYRHRVMAEEVGKQSIKQLDHTSDFDRIMLRFATDAEDWDLATHFSRGGDIRLAHLIERYVGDIFELGRQLFPTSEAVKKYIGGILRQSRLCTCDLVDWRLDISSEALLTLLRILDVHRRRLCRLTGRSPRERISSMAGVPAIAVQVS